MVLECINVWSTVHAEYPIKKVGMEFILMYILLNLAQEVHQMFHLPWHTQCKKKDVAENAPRSETRCQVYHFAETRPSLIIITSWWNYQMEPMLPNP